jgi:DNA polymerase-1
MEGFEADDLIATYAGMATEAGRRRHHHLVRQGPDAARWPVGVDVRPDEGQADRVPEVIEKWGVPPEKMIDLQALTGDSVDNVPGVPGIGPKTAAQLLDEYGDLDNLLANASQIKQQKRRESIIENKDKALISRELVRLKTDVPGVEPLSDFVLQPPDGPKLIAFLKAMEFTTLTRRVAEASGTDAAEVEPAVVVVDLADAHGPDVGSGAVSGIAPTPYPSPQGGRGKLRR